MYEVVSLIEPKAGGLRAVVTINHQCVYGS